MSHVTLLTDAQERPVSSFQAPT